MGRTWKRVDIKCATELADELASELADAFGSGVEYLPGGLRMYFESGVFDEKCSLFERILESAASCPEHRGARISWSSLDVPDEDWSEKWKAHFKPMRVGMRFLIAPTWEPVNPGPGERLIRIDPGSAFGTGHHETTRLCLEWLERWAERRLGESLETAGSLLDVGTGSGILSIGAALVGFDHVVGIDNDPEVIGVAVSNVKLNRFSAKIRVLSGSARDVDGNFDVVISNIQALPLIGMSGDLIARVLKGGRLVLSGILSEQADEVRAAYESGGAELRSVEVAGEWVLLDFEIPKRTLNER